VLKTVALLYTFVKNVVHSVFQDSENSLTQTFESYTKRCTLCTWFICKGAY